MSAAKSSESSAFKRRATRESLLLIGLLVFGVTLLPIGVYLVGQAVFGAYGGDGIGEFMGSIAKKLLAGDRVAWFLVMSPYIAIQSLRLTAAGFRAAGKL